MAEAVPGVPEAEWLRLQKKRLATRRLPPLDDVVADIHKGSSLVDLCEILSEKTGPKLVATKFRAQELENMTKALKFVFDSCGVQMSLKPSPENLLKGDEKDFSAGDEDEGGEVATNAKDALLRWVQLNTAGYAHVDVKSFKGSFNNGMAFCALIDKFKPELIPYAELNPSNDKENLTRAMDAAEKWFGLEKYLVPSDIPKLDEKSLVVYVSEYYTGIIEQLKLDLAARRIKKLIHFTETNDELRKQFLRDAPALRNHAIEIEKFLKSISVKDNTLAGAKDRLQKYKDHRAREGRGIFNDQIKLEAVYTNLASRLADNNRPPFICDDPELRVDSLVQRLDRLQELEQSIVTALHDDLSFQFRLQQLDSQHRLRHENIMQWLRTQKEALPDVAAISSSGGARNAIKQLEAYAKESLAMKSGLEALFVVGKELADGQFEGIAAVRTRESDATTTFAALDRLATEQKPLFEDALQRQMFREQTHLSAKVHADLCRQLLAWGAEQTQYLKTRETINSRVDAELHLNLLEAHYKQKGDMAEGSVKALKALGADICQARFASKLSSWQYETPQQITAAENSIEHLWDELLLLATDKQLILDDHLQREEFTDKTRLMAGQHHDQSNQLQAWITEKQAYLERVEVCNTIAEARFHLSVFEAYEKEMASMTATNYTSLKTLGTQIQGRKYKTEYSEYRYENLAEIVSREAGLEKQWQELQRLAASRAPILRGHVDRNVFQNKVRLLVSCHAGLHDKLASWVADKRTYLQTKEQIDSIQKAQLQRGLLAAYDQEKQDLGSSVEALKTQGSDIRSSVYRTQFSTWQYEHVADVTLLETSIADAWRELSQLSAAKQAVLDDDLAREQFKERTRLWVRGHLEMFNVIKKWADEKLAYLNTKEDISSSEPARQHLSLMDALQTAFAGMTESNVPALRKLGDEIRAAKYETKHSSWVYEQPEEVSALEKTVATLWNDIRDKSAHKQKVLEDDLAREQFKERTRLWVRNHLEMFNVIKKWADEKLAYLNTKEDISSSEPARQHLSLMDALQTAFAGMTESNVPALRKLGDEIRAAKYETQYSTWVHEHPEDVSALEKTVATLWNDIRDKSAHKQKVLEDDLAREQFKAFEYSSVQERTRLWVRNHLEMFNVIKKWADEKLAYLNTKEDISSSEPARQHLSLMDALQTAFAGMTESNVPALRKLGDEVRAAKYETQYSTWVHEHPEELTQLEKTVATLWNDIRDKSAHKQKVLEDDLAREQFKERTRLWVGNHLGMFNVIKIWADEKLAYLNTKEDISSSEPARQHLSLMDALQTAFAGMTESNVPPLRKLGDEIRAAKYHTQYSTWVYEHPEELTLLEKTVATLWNDIRDKSAHKQKVLEDDLAREQFKERTRLWVRNHLEMFNYINAWAEEKLAYLQVKEVNRSSESAKQHLSLLDAFMSSLHAMTTSNVRSLQKQGDEILRAKYATAFSQWVYEQPDEIKRLEATVDSSWNSIKTESTAKRARLDDDLARESYAEHTRLLADQYMRKAALLDSWAADQLRYLHVKEDIKSSHDASVQLSLLGACDKEVAATTQTSLASLKALDREIVARKYQTALSEYSYEKVADIRAADDRLQTAWTSIQKQAAAKLAVLEDDLARHEFKERVELWASCFGDSHTKLVAWVEDKSRFLKAREQVDSVQRVELQLSLLEAYGHEKHDLTEGGLAAFTRLAADIQGARYSTSLSSWVHPDLARLSAVEKALVASWSGLDVQAATKQAWLDDALPREQLRSKVYLRADQHKREHARLEVWVTEKKAYLKTQEAVDSITDARLLLRLLDAFDTEQALVSSTTVSSLNELGAEILSTTYSSPLSQWKYEEPAVITQRKATAESDWKEFAALSKAKRARLDKELENEVTKENLRLEVASVAAGCSRFVRDNMKFISARTVQRDPQSGVLGFTVDEFEAYGRQQTAEDERVAKEISLLSASYESLLVKLEAFGAVKNPYTDLTRDRLQDLNKQLAGGLQGRKGQFEDELERQLDDEAFCEKFAESANPLLKHIATSMAQLMRPKGSLDQQLALISSLQGMQGEHDTQLASLRTLEQDMTKRRIAFNRHCASTASDIEKQLRDYGAILVYKRPQLEQEIDYKKLRGVTPAQIAEIESFFRQFDRDNSGFIDRKEMRSCLFSLGEERPRSEIEQLVQQFGKDGRLSLPQFRQLMIHLLGVSYTQDNITQGFEYIARGRDSVPTAVLARFLTAHEIAFITATTPATADGIVYGAWVADVFSR